MVSVEMSACEEPSRVNHPQDAFVLETTVDELRTSWRPEVVCHS
jgi:hypothetical protein